MHFDDQDTATAFSLPAATLPSLPAVTTELSTSLDDLRIFLSERFHNQAEATRLIDDAQSDVLSRLHTIKRDILSALMQQEEALRNLINTARQDGRTLDDAQTLRFNEFRKVVLAQSVSATADMLDVRKDIKALDAKVTSLDELVAATRNDLLEFRAQAQQTLNIVTDQLSELVAYINRGGNDKKGEVSSSRPPPDDQNRGSGNTGGGGDTIETLWKDLLLLIKKEKGAEGTEVDPTKEEDTVGEPWRIRIPFTDSSCKNQLVVVSVQYGPFYTYIPIRSTTIGKSRVAIDPIAMHTSWRSNSDIASVTSIGYPRMRASGESSTTKHRLLHASGPHPIPPPSDPNAPAELSSSADCDDIIADVIIADSRSCTSSQMLIVITSSLLLIASSRMYADVITADSRFLFASIQQLISSTSEHCSLLLNCSSSILLQ
ncbi:hypothetical protein F511_40458 [Dorcoceras hygrometricum]|uniref:Uncharacterized protein n=1 Tax=Dorcoceras hygrometricum TaxID=472368 RepID=A0A2Z7AMM5_9LAMI|nr:hypothetical protein F511_40458 [Dorcoceras hygrometricum]